MFSFFDSIRVLNTPSAPDRWEQTVIELARVGIEKYARFEAVPDIGPHQSFNRSVNSILLDFWYHPRRKNVLLLEDDVQFLNTDPLRAAIQELPEDWDILYLGCNVAENGFKAPLQYSQHLRRVTEAWTTHAIAFNRRCVFDILRTQPDFSERMFDNWLSTRLEHLNAFCVTPMVAVQRPGQSLIWGQDTNYSDIFTRSNQILINT